MASVLKRKRGAMEVLESPKRSRSMDKEASTASMPDFSNAGWDAAFGSVSKPVELSLPNNHGNDMGFETSPGSIVAVNFEDWKAPEKRKRKKKAGPRVKDADAIVAHTLEDLTAAAQTSPMVEWKISESIGGRMINVDPAFTEDDKFIIVAQQTSLSVYSTTDSLLIRSIPFDFMGRRADARVIAHALSPTDPKMIWVACSDGIVYYVNWTTSGSTQASWVTSTMGIISMAVASMDSVDRRRDIVYTTEAREGGGWRITAHELALPGGPVQPVARVIYTSNQEVQTIKAVSDGSILLAAAGSRVLLGNLRSLEFGTVDKIKYEFRVFESTDYISSLDVRVSEPPHVAEKKASKLKKARIVDAVVGDTKGAIFVHHDLLANLIKHATLPPNSEMTASLLPRKLHWHRKAVRSVKWSLDGNYIISGGSETVMVLWQLDTGKQQYLPHMSAAIQNIVVSPLGASYAIRLADNSTMVLSAAELTPTAHISGIQAQVLNLSPSPDDQVQRLREERHKKPVIERLPALINPAYPSQLLLAVGDVQEINPKLALLRGVPYLQTFDITSSHTLSRQALTRTNVTNKLIAPNAHRISEARVLYMQISHNGKWLATVDEWMPPKPDVAFLRNGSTTLQDEQRRRREVYLKFWHWNETGGNWDLVSRIDAPHAMAPENYGAGRILGLAADPSSLTFSTIGEDGIICIWRPRVRRRDGIIVCSNDGEPLMSWGCHQMILTSKADFGDEIAVDLPARPEHGCLTFSPDGSILAAALTGREDGIIHLIDVSTGSLTMSRSNISRGDVISIAFLSQYLIILCDDLRVYDVVLDELKYDMILTRAKGLSCLSQRAEMMHLAVDQKSGTFAVALPAQSSHHDWIDDGSVADVPSFLARAHTEIAVFNPQSVQPLITKSLSSLATALIPAIGSPGYVILDARAQIITLAPKTSQALTSMAKPITELGLDSMEEESPSVVLTSPIEDADGDIEENEDADHPPGYEELADDNDDDDDGPPVVSQQQLASIFDVGPAFALPPIEEMFYQVADLFSSKPVSQALS
ncbi:MAG: hypothetical protein M1818_002146 [Claussenomyces sp. TS43310]|nr:MAG: hypothetical protein M1818_002146 [Claussenomyces sp. TS43310]